MQRVKEAALEQLLKIRVPRVEGVDARLFRAVGVAGLCALGRHVEVVDSGDQSRREQRVADIDRRVGRGRRIDRVDLPLNDAHPRRPHPAVRQQHVLALQHVRFRQRRRKT
jgi:hypothetical protein